MVEWSVSESVVKELMEAGVAGIRTRLQALLVYQYCSVHDLSVLEFVRDWYLDGLTMVPMGLGVVTNPVGLAEVSESESEASLNADWNFWHLKYSNWREESLAVDRLEMLRKHIDEVEREEGISAAARLREMEARLARVVEGQPTLGMVADDSPADPCPALKTPSPKGHHEEPLSAATGKAEQGEMQTDDTERESGQPGSVSTMLDDGSDERADIAAVLRDPASASSLSAAPEQVRRDSKGVVLANESTLDQLFQQGGRLGMNRVQVEESLCAKLKLRHISDLSQADAEKILAKMRSRAASA